MTQARRGPLLPGLLVIAVVSVAVAAQSPQDLYPRGLVQEHANGDLEQAIALYAQVVQTAGADRPLAAKALIRMAGSYEKLGSNAEAEKTYAQLLRIYPEQRTEVARARERLKALRNATGAVPATQAVVHHIDRAPDTELARRLATFLWGSRPDATLLQAAELEELSDPVVLVRQVNRMLRDPRADAFIDSFFRTWLSLDRLREVRPDPVVFPQVDAALLEAVRTETRLFVRSQVREDRDAVELWIAPYTFVNERLARHYGLSGITGEDFRRVTWPDSSRAGILGQAGPLMALSMASRTSPTMRGSFVINRYFGFDVPQPPVNTPPLAGRSLESHETMREQMLTHRTNPACASCHAMFDPVGLALENFDAIGRWRTEDGGSPIDASGTLTDGTRFNGPAELRVALLKHRPAYYANVAERLLAHALNRRGGDGRVYDYEMPAVRQIVRDASPAGYRWSSLIAGVAVSEPFQAQHVVP